MYVDFAFLWEWEYDEDFVNIVDSKCQNFGLQTYLIHPFNLLEITKQIEDGQFSARVFYDRAADANPAFEPVAANLLRTNGYALNHPDLLVDALDKAIMHHQLIEHGLHVPYTITLTPHRDWTKIKIGELMRLGEPFIIKPALGGGGVGVEVNAKTLFDIVKAREGKSKEKFLLQEKVLPAHFGDRRAWFRVYYACGHIISCWWDDLTHIYYRVLPEEEQIYGLKRLQAVALKIAEITGLNFFSTEIAIVDKETFVVVDYVNDQCDMRLKSKHFDGVPDDVVDEIAFELAHFVFRKISSLPRMLKVADRMGTS